MSKKLPYAWVLALLPAVSMAQDDDLRKANAILANMREIVVEVEKFAEQTKEDAIKQTCIAGAHGEMSRIVASVEKALQEAAGQGPEGRAQALRTVEAGMATVQQLRSEMFECIGAEDLGPGGTPARTYDPIRSSRSQETVGIPALRPPAASATK